VPVPSQIVILGASGYLTRRKLVPALARLGANGSAKQEFSLVGVPLEERRGVSQ